MKKKQDKKIIKLTMCHQICFQSLSDCHLFRQTIRQIDRQIDRQTLTDRQTAISEYIYFGKQSKQTDRQTNVNRQTDGQTDRQTN